VAPPPFTVARLQAALAGAWHVQWSNDRKHLYWRLLLDGLPTLERMHMEGTCSCGGLLADRPGREHHFWHCAVAQAVVAVLRRCVGAAALPAAPLAAQLAEGARLVTASRLWLMQPPRGVLAGVWQVVCLAAVNAIWRSRWALRASRYSGWRLAQPGFTPAGHAGEVAVGLFWDLLGEFCASGRPGRSWRRCLKAGSPFLHFPSPGGGLAVHRLEG
jgi:hypothetical protein